MSFEISCRNIDHYFNGSVFSGMEHVSYDVNVFYYTFSIAISTDLEVISFLKNSRLKQTLINRMST